MSVAEGPMRPKDSLRRTILQAAGELFATHGYENTSMRKIAERIDYSPTTIYLHFRDKAELLLCLCEETFSALNRRLAMIDEGVTCPIDRLKRRCRAYVEFGIEHPNHYCTTFMMPDSHQVRRPDRDSTLAAGMACFNHLRDGVQGCIDAGLFRIRDAETAAQVLWSSMHGLTSLLVAKCQFPWVDREVLISTAVDTIVGGLIGGATPAAADGRGGAQA